MVYKRDSGLTDILELFLITQPSHMFSQKNVSRAVRQSTASAAPHASPSVTSQPLLSSASLSIVVRSRSHRLFRDTRCPRNGISGNVLRRRGTSFCAARRRSSECPSHLKDKLWNSDWFRRESGILALGAMAEGTRFHAPLIRVPAQIILNLFRLYRCY